MLKTEDRLLRPHTDSFCKCIVYKAVSLLDTHKVEMSPKKVAKCWMCSKCCHAWALQSASRDLSVQRLLRHPALSIGRVHSTSQPLFLSVYEEMAELTLCELWK